MTSGTVDQPAQVDGTGATAIGKVTGHTLLQLPTGTCTPYTASGVNDLDVALIEIDHATAAQLEVLDIGPLTGITPRPQIQQGQLMEFTGRASGHRTLKVGGLGVIYQLKAGGQTDLFSESHPTLVATLLSAPRGATRQARGFGRINLLSRLEWHGLVRDDCW